MLFGFLLVVFLLVCIFLVLIVLIQSDKGGGLSGAIGGGLGGASNFLGAQDTANILTRGTAIFGAAFFVLCLVMAMLASGPAIGEQASMLQEKAAQEQSATPAAALEGRGLPFDEGEAADQEGVPSDNEGALEVPLDVVPEEAAPSEEQE
ncbi:preprotein translocase subunit SecG [Chitinispirillales bacterium ANBcel5]|uniref:preprotein translocase subunit SecG n=1 Tax=Cellulosispirillum alkaliphilum TaxID=3039283 RepID=UPI002A5107C4|nr:preprotein translocase subunit SecG [Chitinispirillales bacterium ANBcel5]